jgi:mannose-6-phosphate isomerase-like protein (cupin superfamily)
VEALSSVNPVTYVGDAGEVSAEFHARDDVERLTFRTSGTHVRFVAPGAATKGQFGLFEWNMQPRTGGADSHFHRTFSESFFVTSGTVEFYDGSAGCRLGRVTSCMCRWVVCTDSERLATSPLRC